MRLRVFHRSQYIYFAPVTESYNELRLMPISKADQSCLDFRLDVEPPARVFAYDLPSGRVHYFNVRAPHQELTITAESLVVTHRHDPFAGLDPSPMTALSTAVRACASGTARTCCRLSACRCTRRPTASLPSHADRRAAVAQPRS